MVLSVSSSEAYFCWNTTVSRKPNRICTPVWATLTSWISSPHLRSARSSSVSCRPHSLTPGSFSVAGTVPPGVFAPDTFVFRVPAKCAIDRRRDEPPLFGRSRDGYTEAMVYDDQRRDPTPMSGTELTVTLSG